MDARRQQFIDERCGGGCGKDSEDWVSGFSPRKSVEPVRNCTQVDRLLSGSIISNVALRLLQTEYWVCGCGLGRGCAASRGVACVTDADVLTQQSREGAESMTIGRSPQTCRNPWNMGGEGWVEDGGGGGGGGVRWVGGGRTWEVR